MTGDTAVIHNAVLTSTVRKLADAVIINPLYEVAVC